MKEVGEKKMSVSKWYVVYRKKIRDARSDNEIDKVIDEIFEEGVEFGKERTNDFDHDDMRIDLD